MLYKTKPRNFNPLFEIVACYCLYQRKILYLHRHTNKSEGGKWGIPAGKKESHETIKQAMVREIFEETGLVVTEKQLNYLKKYYVQYSDKDFVYHTFKLTFFRQPQINIASYEHQEYCWVTPRQALRKLNLIQDEDQSLKLTFGL